MDLILRKGCDKMDRIARPFDERLFGLVQDTSEHPFPVKGKPNKCLPEQVCDGTVSVDHLFASPRRT